ncbi:MAG: hypothetical protein A3D20_03885 [Nitrospinae bacterium RIFCSPHIGHO2_02_FULL_39_82]|nr:MAG: hypothetical protein A3D20_03885 [Nitrospinae bacterium RIFCSPHIGHO2_02_FULL_39_82]
MGHIFFPQFIEWVWKLRLPLCVFFSAYVVWKLWLLRPHERWHAILMSSYFFFIISIYWLIKPIKKTLLVGYYQVTGLTLLGLHLDAAQVELVAKEINLLLSLLAALSFAKLASRFKREKLALYIIIFFILGFITFVSLLYNAEYLTIWMFYLYGDIFVTLMLASFFAFLNDSGDVQTARRLYGLIVLGGVLGGFFGSAVVANYARKIEPPMAALICAGLLVVIAVIALWFGSLVKWTAPIESPGIASTRRYKNGLRTIISSPYILGIASMVGLYEMVSAIMDYQFTSTVLHFVSGEQLKVYFASVYYFTNFISLILQLFLTTLVMTRFGVATALLFLPFTIMIGESAFILLPGLLLGSLLNTIDNAFSYSINQSAKEVLYVPVEREKKYQAKAFIDIFILRCAKGIAVAFSLMLTLIFAGFEGMRWLSLIVLGLLFIWLTVVRYIGQSYKKMEKPD